MNTTLVVNLERYVAGVLAGESSVFHSDEALKAMAVAARTYARAVAREALGEGFDFCTTTHCQRVELDGITPRLESDRVADRRRTAVVRRSSRPSHRIRAIAADGPKTPPPSGPTWPHLT